MMLRSAASPGSVGLAGRYWRIAASSYRCQYSDRPPTSSRRPDFCWDDAPSNENAAPWGGVFVSGEEARLLDLRFLELDVLLRDRVVLTLGHLVGHRAAVLRSHVEEAGVRRREKFDLDGGSLGHFYCPLVKRSGRRIMTGGSPIAENSRGDINEKPRKSRP